MEEAAEKHLQLVAHLTDLEAIDEVTILERRQDFLLKPLLQALSLFIDPRFPQDVL